VLLCRRLSAQRSKALSCEEQVETARSDWKGKSYADVSLDRVTRFSIYALHLTTNVYNIYIYIYIYLYIYVCVFMHNSYHAGHSEFPFSAWP